MSEIRGGNVINEDFTKRRVFVNVEPSSDFFDESGAPRQLFESNEVHTAKYNVITFIPKTIFEQFRYSTPLITSLPPSLTC